MSQGDPTDNALAAIASILDQPEIPRESVSQPPLPEDTGPPQAQTQAISPVEAHGYSKQGPGPMAAIRFRWTVRAGNGEFFVDETIGENSSPRVTGPLTREAAIQLVDDRESEARRRFDQLKHEMTGRAAAAKLVRKDAGEA